MPEAPKRRAEDNPWPQWPKVCKTDYGQEEAIALFGHDPRIYQTTVKEFIKDKNGKLCGLTTVKLESRQDEKTGRTVLAEVPGSEQKLDADLALIAAGFLGTEAYAADAFGITLNERMNVQTEPESYETNVKHVFAAGDMRRGQSLVVWAIREGREAARDMLDNQIVLNCLNQAVSAHQDWLGTLKEIAETGILKVLQTDCTKCGLGHFYYALKPIHPDIAELWAGLDGKHVDSSRCCSMTFAGSASSAMD